MSAEVMNVLVAVTVGSVVAVLLLIPVAAVQYRRQGRLAPGDLVVLLAAAVYGVAIWTWTLLPAPSAATIVCEPTQLDLLYSIRPVVREVRVDGLRNVLGQQAFLQVSFNVLLFVPFGYFVRRVLRRGFLIATLLGLVTSLLVETTQLTGVWGIFGCAYRIFDVDDLLLNTVGALVGSVLSALVVRRRRRPAPQPTTLTLGRRLIGMTCDLLFIALTGAAVALAWRAYQLFGLDRPADQLDLGVQAVLQAGVPLTVEGLLVLGAGRTLGELVVSVRAVARWPRLVPLSRLVKLLTGVGGLFALLLLDVGYDVAVLTAYAFLTLTVAWRSRGHRGLSHVLSGMDLVIANREATDVATISDEPPADEVASGLGEDSPPGAGHA